MESVLEKNAAAAEGSGGEISEEQQQRESQNATSESFLQNPQLFNSVLHMVCSTFFSVLIFILIFPDCFKIIMTRIVRFNNEQTKARAFLMLKNGKACRREMNGHVKETVPV